VRGYTDNGGGAGIGFDREGKIIKFNKAAKS